MDLNAIKEKLKKDQLLDAEISKYTNLVDESMRQQGILFFVSLGTREIKVVLPAPHHENFLENHPRLTYSILLNNKHIIVLK